MAARDFMQFMSRGDIPLLDPLMLEQQVQEDINPRVLRRALASMAGRVLPPNVRLASAEGPGDLSGVAQFGEASAQAAEPAQASVLPSAVQRYRDRASELYKQGADLYGQEPDMSQFEEFARQRAQGGNAAMLNALAAQFAGEQFQPVQAQFLKKAAAAQDPIKLGSGMLTPEGRYIKDPIAAQDKRAEFLLQQARAYETLAQTAATAEERAEAARLAREAAERHRELIAEMQRSNINSQIENRGILAGIAQQGADTARQRAQSDASNQVVMQGIARDNADTSRMIAQRARSGDGGPGGTFSQAGFTPQGEPVVSNRSGMNFLIGVQPDGKPTYTPYQGPMIPKASFDKEVMAAADLSSIAARADGLVKQVEQNPAAFGLRSAAVSAMPGALQSYAAIAVGLTPEQLRARSTVLRQAAQEINELYGAALSMGEQARANTFLPNASDEPGMLIAKLMAARDWAKTQLGRYSPGVMNAARSRAGASAGGGSSNVPAVGTVKDGYRFKGGDPAQASNWEKL